MDKLLKFYINGEWVDPLSTDKMPVLNPASAEQVGEVALGNDADVDRAVAAAQAAFEHYSQTSKADRLALLGRIREVTERRFEELAQAMRLEMGAPITMARDAQADAAIGHLDGFVAALEKLEEQERFANGEVLLREPIGVCGLITPWNWPMNQVVLKVIPVIATGCACVLKPSEHTPISAMLYAEILHEAGVPAGVFNLVNGVGPVVGSALSRHPDIQMMSFTGSTRAGTAVTREAADSVKRVTLELGGKSPNIYFSDIMQAEESFISKAVEGMVLAFFNQGEVCTCPSRALIQEDMYDDFIGMVLERTRTIKRGNPLDTDTQVGAQASEQQFDKILSYLEIAQQEGAQVLTGGAAERLEGDLASGYYIQPTLLKGSNEMRVFQEEIFGPVIGVTTFKDEAEALAIANDTEFGLAGYFYTRDLGRAFRVGEALEYGMVGINTGLISNEVAPFGGMKSSGLGREGSKYGIEEYVEIKYLCLGGI